MNSILSSPIDNLESRKMQKRKQATVAIKSTSRSNFISKKTNLGKNLPNTDKNKTCSYGRNRNLRRHATIITTWINLEVNKAT